ncbi:hypothetical protein GCM10011490_22820 [Pseudoclavibacter endophyticus]|uniref:PHP domain-containing protein n=1 Tax=Pseudoclavibacter endophyticus TaxID=1778590 RepID=A0A6H9WKM3_9MICO|nr:PHP domain-containing protein [Pseudoclavibacter endophyticus]KAB1648309.1 PHP domain-containing protein [Pseudoclavibacter endophyticus]GGA71547.1 hypothetical protein GCM10011490_22820 [Pseudoclavibacter endophyticus]
MSAEVSLLEDWHIHSTFSDDAVSSIDENIVAAEARGLRRLRLTDHVRASTAWVPEFAAAVRRARGTTEVDVRSGVEAKILDARGTLDAPPDLLLGEGGVDDVVIADHQFPGVDGPWSPRRTRELLASTLRASDAIDLLVQATIGAMRLADGRGQLAHPFSILPKVGLDESQVTDEHLRAWAQAARKTGTRIEVNEKWACPSPRAIAAAMAAGATVVASSDSHDAASVGHYVRVRDLLAAARDLTGDAG